MAIGLICVVSGDVYLRYAEQLFASAREHVDLPLNTYLLEGREGWPAATLYRYHAILENPPDDDWLFLCDADMRFEGRVGAEILNPIVATRHPGYIGKSDLPFERRRQSAAYLSWKWRGPYYAGGFVGGERKWFLHIAKTIKAQIDTDDRNRVLARWHDESHLNRALASNAPTLILSPSYCYPDDDSWYRTIWPESYERKLVALDKTPAERRGR